MISHEIGEVVVIINKENNTIREKIVTNYNGVLSIKFVIQHIPKGPLHAVHLGPEVVPSENKTLVILGDAIYQDKLIFDKDFVLYKTVLDWIRWCLVETDPSNKILQFYDKPRLKPHTNKALIGVYFLKRTAVLKDIVKKIIESEEKLHDEFQISTALKLYACDHSIYAKEASAWFDCGSPDNYKRTIDEFSRL